MKISLVLISFFLFWGCHSNENHWSETEKEQWIYHCNESFDKERKDKGILLKDMCDCLLSKVEMEYTPEEADKMDISREHQLLEECHYYHRNRDRRMRSSR